jgi:hypothetical protein
LLDFIFSNEDSSLDRERGNSNVVVYK